MEILVIGCGGLGCELIKILLQDRRSNLTIVDDDTVDVTNLNRQFLFTRNDIGKSKSETVARKVRDILKLQEADISAIFGNIRSFPHIGFYQRFSVVYCCLDNNETRSFVNQRCHASGVPMVDGGSAGWLGQSFFNGEECFDCLPKHQEQVYPICSIRQQPKSFEHCLAWGMEIVDSRGIESLRNEIAMHTVSSETRATQNQGHLDAVLGNENHKTADSSVDFAEDECAIAHITEDEIVGKSLRKRLRTNDDSSFELCKDRMRLIYSAALLRARRFGIRPFSFIDSQTFVSKIIPSVCTTNSIVASLMVLSRANRKNYYLVHGRVVRVSLNEKRNDCLTCSLPVYRCDFPDYASTSDFFKLFGVESLVDEARFYYISDEKLLVLDGRFGIAIKNGLRHRVYFEKHIGELSIRRIR